MGERIDRDVKSPSLSLKRRKKSTKAKTSVREKERRKDKEKIRNTTPRIRSVPAKIIAAVDTF